MELEQQVTSLELSKRLKEFGVKQESLFYWIKPSSSQNYFIVTEDNLKQRDINTLEGTPSAFTIAELFQIFAYEKIDIWVYHNAGKYLIQSHAYSLELNEEKLSDCLAKMLIYLIENKLIKI